MISLVKGRRKTLFPLFVPFLLLTVNTMKHLFRLIMSLDLTLPSFLLTLEEKNSFIHFISPTDVRSTRVMCFAWGFPFQLGRAGMKRNGRFNFVEMKRETNQIFHSISKEKK